ncbi:MAG: DUF5131 family protein, partial [Chitinophagaceae bacterium]
MAKNSKIEWTDHTANLWHGCAKVHIGCEHCYAEDLTVSWGEEIWGNDKPRKAIKSVWTDLAEYQRLAKQNGRIDRVFVGSMQDIFEKPMPLIDWKGRPLPYTTDALRRKLFQKIHWRMYPNLLFLLLTKRPPNINKLIPQEWKTKPPVNVMLGCSVSDQATADQLIPQLFTVNGRRFLSVEPQLGPVDLTAYLHTGRIHWVIQG